MRPTSKSIADGAPTTRAPSDAGSKIAPFTWDGRIVAMGASTGGVEALTEMISQFPANGPAALVVQHIPAAYIKRFAERLDRLSAARVEEAFHGALLGPGTIYIAPGACHLELRAGAKGFYCRLIDHEPVNGFKPSVDVLFHSVALVAGAQAIGVIMSGMGHDGVKGLKAMREAGARTLGQDAASSAVYGMPRAAFEIGAVERQVPLGRLAKEILKLTNAHATETF
ncbi:MAG: two-component system, chemotaxis family, protein-glutamate methylesterase/glutaminase [Alphaproteobacteria bacterium]|jgi:two-component system chemotaxis response regulator CheB|nr:two-component system, chemotaxis family, protein-glutamate methylesterase/glutaminase [Alphaproteobacteria bacterium]